MAKTLTLAEVVRLYIQLHPKKGRVLLERLRKEVNEAAADVAEILKVSTGGIDWDADDPAGGPTVAFRPGRKGQKCPAALSAADEYGIWELNGHVEFLEDLPGKWGNSGKSAAVRRRRSVKATT